MGAYAYCQHCDAPLGPPSAREVVDQRRECPHCGKYSEVYDSVADVIERLEGRVEELEEIVRRLDAPYREAQEALEFLGSKEKLFDAS